MCKAQVSQCLFWDASWGDDLKLHLCNTMHRDIAWHKPPELIQSDIAHSCSVAQWGPFINSNGCKATFSWRFGHDAHHWCISKCRKESAMIHSRVLSHPSHERYGCSIRWSRITTEHGLDSPWQSWMHPHTLPQYLWAICSQHEATCQAEVSCSIKPLYLISSGTIGLLWVLYTNNKSSFSNARPYQGWVDHGLWTVHHGVYPLATLPDHCMSLLDWGKVPEPRRHGTHAPPPSTGTPDTGVTAAHTLALVLCGALQMQHQGPPWPGEKVQKKMGQWPTVAAPQMVVPIVPSLHTTSSSCTSPLNGMGRSHFAATTCSHPANAKGQSSAVMLLHRPASSNPLGKDYCFAHIQEAQWFTLGAVQLR